MNSQNTLAPEGGRRIQSQSSPARAYVPGIDTLRALAVVSVILYHLGVGWLPGGFVGVDVFFVISGYVVTESLARDSTDSLRKFISRFYIRRIARIYPALVACLLVSFVLAVLFIPSSWLSSVSWQSGLLAFFGMSNLALVSSDGYFAPRMEFNPFTHTWSLAVEEQFYLIYPLLMFAWLKWHRTCGWRGSVSTGAVASLAAGSLMYSAWTTIHAPESAFYLLPSRFWELCCGALLYQHLGWRRFARTTKFTTRFALPAGLGLILLGFLLIRATQFPFPWAIVPVAGTMLCIMAAVTTTDEDGSFCAHVLQQRVLVYVGTISYSLYLWHWPILVLFRWTIGLEQSWKIALASALITVCAIVSFHGLEVPFRQRFRGWRGSPPRFLGAGLAAISLCSLGAAGLVQARPWLSLSEVSRHASDWYPYPVSANKAAPEALREFGGRQLFVIGDSHAGAYATLLSLLEQQTGITVHSLWRAGCAAPPLTAPMSPGCARFVEHAIDRLEKEAVRGDVVFLPGLRTARLCDQWTAFDFDDVVGNLFGAEAIASRSLALEEADSLLQKLLKTGVRVLIESPKPVYPSPPFRCSDWFNAGNPICRGGIAIDRNRLRALIEPVKASIVALKARHPDLLVYDPFPILCPGEECRAVDGAGRPLYFDGDHLSGHGNLILYESFRSALRSSFAHEP